MKLLRTKGAIELPDGIRLLPFTGYVLPDGVADAVASETLKQTGRTGVSVSHFNSFKRPFAGQNLQKKSLLIYRHAALGDTLIATGLVAYIRKQNPNAIIDVYTSEPNLPLWQGLGVRAFAGFPTSDAARQYDYHLLFEYMLEANSEPDQQNCYDDMFAYAGYDPATVPPEYKRPHVPTTQAYKPGTHICYHVWASNPNRCYPSGHSAQLLTALRQAFPDRELLIVGKDEHQFFKYHPEWKAFHHETSSFRDLVPVIATAALVICPDSSVGHLAAAFPAVPVISLWGIFHPDDRVKYYSNHHPLQNFKVCPHAPCRTHEFNLPFENCKDASTATVEGPENCYALSAIHPSMVIAKAQELLSVESRHIGQLSLVVVTASNGKRPDLTQLTHELNRDYCARHNIDYAVEHIPADWPTHPSWAKIGFIQKYLETYDVVLWVDDDAALVGEEDIRNHLKDATLNIAVDHNGVNCGVMAWMKNGEDALRRIYDSYERLQDHKWFEQAALMEFVDELDVHYVDKALFNAYPEDATPHSIVRHWPGMEHDARIAAIRSFVKGRELKPC